MRKLYKATAIMGVATFTGMIIGVLKAKFTAILLGPAGVGILSQALMFFQSAETVCGLGIGLGITKYISKTWAEQDTTELRKIISASFVMQAIMFAAFFVLIFVFSNYISRFVFSSTQYSLFLVLVSIAVIFSVLIITIESIILGISRPDIFSKARVTYYIIGLPLLLFFVGMMKIKGGFLFIFANALVSFIVVFMFLNRILKLEIKTSLLDILKETNKINLRTYLGKLLSYGGTTLAVSAFTWLTILYVRSILIKNLGADANGFYQVVFALTSYYSPFFTNSLWGYLFPRLSAIKDIAEFNIEVNKAMRFILIFIIPFLAVIYLLRKFLVLLIFSKKFIPSLEIFSLYLLGSFFFMMTYLLGVTLLAKKELKIYFVINIFQNLLLALLFTIWVGKFGLVAIAISYLIANIFTSTMSYLYQFYKMGLALNRQNIILFIFGLLFIMFIFFIPYEAILGFTVKSLLIVMWFLFIVGKKEKALIRSFIKIR